MTRVEVERAPGLVDVFEFPDEVVRAVQQAPAPTEPTVESLTDEVARLRAELADQEVERIATERELTAAAVALDRAIVNLRGAVRLSPSHWEDALSRVEEARRRYDNAVHGNVRRENPFGTMYALGGHTTRIGEMKAGDMKVHRRR